jgi:hypothetical protein
MQKFSFTVDIVSDSSVDTDAIRGTLIAAIDGIGTFEAVHPVKVTALAEQGYKVWAKRVAGVSLAAPKPVKVPKVPKAAKVAEAEVAVAVEA